MFLSANTLTIMIGIDTSSISCPDLLDFGNVEVGYTPEAMTATLTNIGTESISVTSYGRIKPILTRYNSTTFFEIEDDAGTGSIAANGGTYTVTIKPKAGLPAGQYTGTLSFQNTASPSASDIGYLADIPIVFSVGELPLYCGMDVYYINRIIAEQGLDYEQDAPETWDFVTWSNGGAEKRAVGLNLNDMGLTGTLKTTGLDALKSLNCADNYSSGHRVQEIRIFWRFVGCFAD